MTQYYGYKIYPGWNNAGNLVDIQSITPTGDKPFVAPQAYSSWDDGVLRIRADGVVYVTGFKQFTWRFSVLTVAQYQYLVSTYATDTLGYSGPVTVATRGRAGTFANYNAYINIPKLPDLTRRYLTYRDTDILFTRVVAI